MKGTRNTDETLKAYPGFPGCKHIKADGEVCQSPAMSGRHFCYYHTLYRRRNKPNKKTTPALNVAIVDAEDKWHRVEAFEPFAKRYTLGPLEDAASIQVAISTVLNALADQRIDLHRASTLLYGLQLAATNLRTLQNARPAPESPTSPPTAGTYAQVPAGEELSPTPQTEVQRKEELNKTNQGEGAPLPHPQPEPATNDHAGTDIHPAGNQP